MNVSPETRRQIRRIELQTRRLVNTSFAGAYHSVFKGRGIAFDAVRPYQPGDSTRDIDWNVTARNDEAYVKRYAEERELTVMLVCDMSASCLFGSVKWRKRDLAAEVGAVVAFAALANNDKVGLLLFSDRVELFIPPRKGRNHALRLVRELLTASPSGRGTNLSLGLRTLNSVLKQRAIVFLMSDFLATPQEYAADLLVMGRRHDVIALVLSDPREEHWPRVGLVGLADAETGQTAWIDTSAPQWQDGFARQRARFCQVRDTTLLRARVDRVEMPVDGDYVESLSRFFRQRAQRTGR